MQSSDGERTKSSQVAGIPQNLPRSGAVKFVGRDEKLAELHARLQGGERLAITAIKGMGGIGKTELALQYAIAQFKAGSYPGGICWLRARDQEIATQITAFAQSHLGLTLPELEVEEQVRFCWQQWPAGNVLVAIDDVTDYGKIERYLPPSDPRFRLLLTTRLNLGRSVESFSIEELDEASALALLEEIVADGRVRAQWEAAKRLCAWVGCLPLGLELLGRYLADDEDLSIEAVLEELEETRLAAEALQAVSPGMTANLGVVQALELSWRELSEQARDVACGLGMFAVAPIPWDLVERCFEQVEEKVLRKVRQKELLYRSLLKRVGQGQYQLHQIVQEFFRVKLEQKGEAENAVKGSFCSALVAVAESIEQGLTLDEANEIRAAIVHIEEFGESWADGLSDEDFTAPFIGVACFYREQGLYSLALPWCEACLEKTKKRFGDHHPEVATSLNNLALLYRDQGKYAAAEPLLQEALALRKALLGDRHPDVATSLNNLAELYRDQGEYGAAEPLYQEALTLRKSLLGDCHPSVAMSLNNLAELYREKGEYAAAEPLYQEALVLYKVLLGNCHPSVAMSLNNLALLYCGQGKYVVAEPLYQEALARYKALLGDRHPHVAITQWNLGVLYQEQGKYAEARALYEQALAIAQTTLGAEHPHTKGIQSSLNSLPDKA